MQAAQERTQKCDLVSKKSNETSLNHTQWNVNFQKYPYPAHGRVCRQLSEEVGFKQKKSNPNFKALYEAKLDFPEGGRGRGIIGKGKSLH